MTSFILNWLIDRLIKSDKFNNYIEDKVLERYIPEPGLYEDDVMALIRGVCSSTDSDPGGGADQNPTASFTFECTDLTCTFDATSSSDDGAIVLYEWDFGDGNTDTGSQTEHTFDDTGSYVVTLTVTDNANNEDTFVDVVSLSILLDLVEGPEDPAPLPTNKPTKPAPGATYVDPHYSVDGLTHKRLSDTSALTGSITTNDFTVPTYPRRNPFNADNSMVLLETDNDLFLLDGETGEQIGDTAFFTLGNTDRRARRSENVWDYNNPNIMYALASDPFDSTPVVADQFKMNRLNLSNIVANNGVPDVTELFDLRSVNFASGTGHQGDNSILDVFPDADFMWSIRGEGMPSATMVDDGLTFAGAPRYWALAIEGSPFSPSTPLGVVTYDLQTNTIIGILDLGSATIDHVDMSPSGDWVEIAFDNNCPGGAGDTGTVAAPCGTMLFKSDFSAAVGVIRNVPHGDWAIDKEGNDVYVYADFDFALLRYIIPNTGADHVLADFGFIGSDIHVSGNSFNRPGYVVWNQYDTSLSSDPASDEPWLDRIMISELVPDVSGTPGGKTWVLGHTYNRWGGTDSSAPHPAVNYDLTRIAFASNWVGTGSTGSEAMETYVIELDLDNYSLE